MKKILIIAFLVVISRYHSAAQSFFTVQWEVAEPTEGFRESAGTGFGGRAAYMYFVNPRVALVGSVGYMQWGPRVDFPPNNEYKVIAIPVQFGMKLLLSRGVVAPYLGMGIGMDYLRTRGVASNSSTYSDTNELKFGFSPQVGIAVFVAKPIGVNLAGTYNVVYTSSSPSKYFGFDVGLAVGF